MNFLFFTILFFNHLSTFPLSIRVPISLLVVFFTGRVFPRLVSICPLPRAVIAVIRCGLENFYYWVNFAPITRGTSATGYAALYSTILAVDEEVVDRIPHMKQLDWEVGAVDL